MMNIKNIKVGSTVWHKTTNAVIKATVLSVEHDDINGNYVHVKDKLNSQDSMSNDLLPEDCYPTREECEKSK